MFKEIKIEFWGMLGTGVAMGLTGMGISTLSQELIGHKLGYGRMSFKNVFKIAISSGLTTVGVMYAIDRIDKEMKK